ncbi:MAG: RNase adapter RapZ [Candidatus Bipolaricaulia bacterium]
MMVEAEDKPKYLYIVTGMSGAGKTTAIHSLEDVGLYCVDNLPSSLLPDLADHFESLKGRYKGLAISIDMRYPESLEHLDEMGRIARDKNFQPEVIFLDAGNEILVNRFKETRRRHPLEQDHPQLIEAIEAERDYLRAIRGNADYLIDTSDLSLKELRYRIWTQVLGLEHDGQVPVILTSFGYKFGIPLDAAIIYDVRFLPNPNDVEELRPLNGNDPQARDYILEHKITRDFIDRFLVLLEMNLPLYFAEGKTSLPVAIGCTGGRHRSVAIANVLAERLTADGYEIRVSHRDIDKE